MRSDVAGRSCNVRWVGSVEGCNWQLANKGRRCSDADSPTQPVGGGKSSSWPATAGGEAREPAGGCGSYVGEQ
jgi:hypothetical protein